MQRLFAFLLALPLTVALLSVPAQNIIQKDTIDFDSALNAWKLAFSSLPTHTHVVVQVCSGEECNDISSYRTERFVSLTCDELRDKVQATSWKYGTAPLDHQCIPSGQEASLTGVFTEVFPNTIKIANEMDVLKQFGEFHNNTLSLELRVLFVLDHAEEPNEVNRLYTVLEYREILKLKTPTLNFGTLQLSHECSQRGLYTPLRAMLRLKQWRGIEDPSKMPCLWECAEDHVRHPFNSFPPSIADANTSDFLCQPLPGVFTAVQFKFSVFLQGSSPTNGEYTNNFFAAIDSLADDMQASMQDQFDAKHQVLVILMVQDTIFSHEYDESLSVLIAKHAAYTGRYQAGEYEDINLLSRRLLQSQVEISGVSIVADPEITDLSGLRRTIETKADSSLQDYQWPQQLGVTSTDSVIVTRLQRAYQTPPPVNSILNDTFFYIFLLSCAGIIFLKSMYSSTPVKYHNKKFGRY